MTPSRNNPGLAHEHGAIESARSRPPQKESGVREGLALVKAMHITASVFINDDERGLHADYEAWLERLAPHEFAITAGKLDFGPWEQIFYGEFDGGPGAPASRTKALCDTISPSSFSTHNYDPNLTLYARIRTSRKGEKQWRAPFWDDRSSLGV
jgi:hypothetical protein